MSRRRSRSGALVRARRSPAVHVRAGSRPRGCARSTAGRRAAWRECARSARLRLTLVPSRPATIVEGSAASTAGPIAAAWSGATMTGHGACRARVCDTLPSTALASRPRPRVPVTIMVASTSSAISARRSAAMPRSTRSPVSSPAGNAARAAANVSLTAARGAVAGSLPLHLGVEEPRIITDVCEHDPPSEGTRHLSAGLRDAVSAALLDCQHDRGSHGPSFRRFPTGCRRGRPSRMGCNPQFAPRKGPTVARASGPGGPQLLAGRGRSGPADDCDACSGLTGPFRPPSQAGPAGEWGASSIGRMALWDRPRRNARLYPWIARRNSARVPC